jgi:hypothetical protein
MLTTQTDESTVQFIKLGYDVSLSFRATMNNWETFAASLRAIGGYNRFNAEDVIASFRELFDNSMTVEFGRESSPVMYISLPFWTHQRKGSPSYGMGEHYTNEQRQDMARAIIDWARSVHADEISVSQFGSVGNRPDDVWVTPYSNAPGDNPYRIRLWWD